MSEDEALAVLDANRPEAPRPMKAGDEKLAGGSWAQVSGFENHLILANFGADQKIHQHVRACPMAARLRFPVRFSR